MWPAILHNNYNPSRWRLYFSIQSACQSRCGDIVPLYPPVAPLAEHKREKVVQADRICGRGIASEWS